MSDNRIKNSSKRVKRYSVNPSISRTINRTFIKPVKEGKEGKLIGKTINVVKQTGKKISQYSDFKGDQLSNSLFSENKEERKAKNLQLKEDYAKVARKRRAETKELLTNKDDKDTLLTKSKSFAKNLIEKDSINAYVPINSIVNTTKGIGRGAKKLSDTAVNGVKYVTNFHGHRDYVNNNIVESLNNKMESGIRELTKIPGNVGNFIADNTYRPVINTVKDIGNGVASATKAGVFYAKRATKAVGQAYDASKKVATDVANGIKRTFQTGKKAAKFVKDNGIKGTGKSIANNVSDRIKKVNSLAKSLPSKLKNNTKDFAINSVDALRKHVKKEARYLVNNAKDSIINFIIRHQRKIKAVLYGGSSALIVGTIVVNIVGASGLLNLLAPTPHYYCDADNPPTAIKDTKAYRLYCGGGAVNNVVYFQQDKDYYVTNKEASWRGYPYQHSSGPCTIGECGCGPTDFTMAAATFSEDLSYTPDKGGDDYSQIPPGESTIDELNIRISRPTGALFDEIAIKEALDDDCFVQICLATVGSTDYSVSPANSTSAHYVLIVGYDEEGFYIADSFTSQTTMVDVIPGDGMEGVEGIREEPYSFEVLLAPYQKPDGGNAKYCPINKQ